MRTHLTAQHTRAPPFCLVVSVELGLVAATVHEGDLNDTAVLVKCVSPYIGALTAFKFQLLISWITSGYTNLPFLSQRWQ
jgi:hypothetical protein